MAKTRTTTKTITIMSTVLGVDANGEDEQARAELGEELAIWCDSDEDNEYEYALNWDCVERLHEFLGECIEAYGRENASKETENSQKECDHPSTTLYAFNPPRCIPWTGEWEGASFAQKVLSAWESGDVIFVEEDKAGVHLCRRKKGLVADVHSMRSYYPLVYRDSNYSDFLRHALYLDGQTMFFYVQTEEKCS